MIIVLNLFQFLRIKNNMLATGVNPQGFIKENDKFIELRYSINNDTYATIIYLNKLIETFHEYRMFRNEPLKTDEKEILQELKYLTLDYINCLDFK
jgi:hypothetical protein